MEQYGENESFIFAGAGASSIVTAKLLGEYLQGSDYSIYNGNIYNSENEVVTTYGLSGGLMTGILIAMSSDLNDYNIHLNGLFSEYNWSRFTKVGPFPWPFGLGGNTSGIVDWMKGIYPNIKGTLPTIIVKDAKTKQTKLFEGNKDDFTNYASIVAAACTSRTLGLGYWKVNGRRFTDAASKEHGVHAAKMIPGKKTIFDGLGFVDASRLKWYEPKFLMNFSLNSRLGRFFYGEQTGIELAHRVITVPATHNVFDTVLRVVSMQYAKQYAASSQKIIKYGK